MAADTAPGSEWSDLVSWLHELMRYAVTTRGLASTLLVMGEPLRETDSCSRLLEEAVATLVQRASAADALRAGTTAEDVVMLVVGLSHAAQGNPEIAARLLDLSLGGVRLHSLAASP